MRITFDDDDDDDDDYHDDDVNKRMDNLYSHLFRDEFVDDMMVHGLMLMIIMMIFLMMIDSGSCKCMKTLWTTCRPAAFHV